MFLFDPKYILPIAVDKKLKCKPKNFRTLVLLASILLISAVIHFRINEMDHDVAYAPMDLPNLIWYVQGLKNIDRSSV